MRGSHDRSDIEGRQLTQGSGWRQQAGISEKGYKAGITGQGRNLESRKLTQRRERGGWRQTNWKKGAGIADNCLKGMAEGIQIRGNICRYKADNSEEG